MSGEPPIGGDPVLRRVAAVRPSIPEDELAPGGPHARAIAERVLAGSPAATTTRSRWARPRWALPRLGLAMVPVVVVIVVLLLSGSFSGPGSSGTQPAGAAVIRAAVRALDPAGTILIQDETYVSGPTVHGQSYTVHQALETPGGSGPQNLLTSYSDPAAAGEGSLGGWAYVGGEQAIYSTRTDTIYETSIWGPYLHPGLRPGTFVYRYAPGAPVYTQHPIAITADERQALLSGRSAIMVTGRSVDGRFQIGPLRVRPALRAPGYAQTVRQWLMGHALHFVARTRLDGRPALELAGTPNGAASSETHIYLDPTTELPFEEVDQAGTPRQQVMRVELRKLPITPETERLLSLHTVHPSARIDRSHRDYLSAAGDTQIYNQ